MNKRTFTQDQATELYNLVYSIGNDYVELSHDKIRAQRDDYQKRCKKLIHGIHKDDPVPEHIPELSDDF